MDPYGSGSWGAHHPGLPQGAPHWCERPGRSQDTGCQGSMRECPVTLRRTMDECQGPIRRNLVDPDCGSRRNLVEECGSRRNLVDDCGSRRNLVDDCGSRRNLVMEPDCGSLRRNLEMEPQCGSLRHIDGSCGSLRQIDPCGSLRQIDPEQIERCPSSMRIDCRGSLRHISESGCPGSLRQLADPGCHGSLRQLDSPYHHMTCPVHSPFRYRFANGGPEFFSHHQVKIFKNYFILCLLLVCLEE